MELCIQQYDHYVDIYIDGVLLKREEALKVLNEALEESVDGTEVLIKAIRLMEAQERRLS